jgi:hypothetical protein
MTALRNWLKQEPVPRRIRMTDAEGETKTIRVNDTKSRWRDAEKSLAQAVRCEALDAEGDTLRVWDAESEQAIEVRVSEAMRGHRSELAELARIINDAHDNSAQRHAEAHRQGMDALVALVKVLSERLFGLEKAWHGLLMSQAQPDDEAPQLPINEQMVMGLLAAYMQKQQLGAQPRPRPGGPPRQGPPRQGPPRQGPPAAPPKPNGAPEQ